MTTSLMNTRRLFEAVTARPAVALGVMLLALVVAAVGLGRLVKDTSVKAFIPGDHASLVADARADALFGLSDTIAVAVITDGDASVFDAETLALVTELTDAIQSLDNIRYDRVVSLGTESSVSGEDGAVLIDPYVEPDAMDAAAVADARARWAQMPPHRATLISEDETGAVVMAELVDTTLAADTYTDVLAIAESLSRPGVTLHVAGPGAISGYLSQYIDQDARKLQPLVFVVVLAFIYFAFRRGRALLGPLIVVAGSAAGALGMMAWLGVPYFAITNALPVIIVAISVADSIHILSAYFALREQEPEMARRECVILAMCTMARPITLTTLTTIAGFTGIALMSIMPPITWFAVFAAVGVALAWLFSMVALPNVLLLVDPGRSPAMARWLQRGSRTGGGQLTRFMTTNPGRPLAVIGLMLGLAVVAGTGATRLQIDRSQVENFAPGEAIRVADETLNEHFAGTAFLDIIVEADAPMGLVTVDAMQRMRDLQGYLESLPHVRKTVSIVDYVALLHAALDELPENDVAARVLPDADALVAETLFTYELNADPADLEEEIDRDYQHALVRGVLNADRFSQTREVVESVQAYIDANFSDGVLRATLAGDVNIGYHWMENLRVSHFKGVALSLVLVVLVSALVFRSITCGIVSAIPVVFTVAMLYASMGFLGIYLEPATSMFAAIALGVGIDFSIHLVDGLRTALGEHDGDLRAAMTASLPPVARACFFNSAALGVGFAVLMTSDLPTLMRFGGLVALAALTSYLVALVFIPAVFALRQQWFLRPAREPARAASAAVLVVLGALVSTAADAETLDAQVVAERVADRADHNASRRLMHMTLIDRKGRRDERTAVLHKRTDDARRRTRVTFTAPRKYAEMAFLSDDPLQGGIATRWMYLPASGRARRIPATRRGRAFFGTDFSYADMQSEIRFELDEWTFSGGEQIDDGKRLRYRLSGTAVSTSVARALGYGAFEAEIDAATWIPMRIEFRDPRGKPLKTISVRAVSEIDGIWTPTEIVATHLRTGHTTAIAFEDIRTNIALDGQLFDAQVMTRGLASLDLGGL
ncbi:MAG: outer membrane lipoprotein-sorting protein [Pseudomonadota bacterium]